MMFMDSRVSKVNTINFVKKKKKRGEITLLVPEIYLVCK